METVVFCLQVDPTGCPRGVVCPERDRGVPRFAALRVHREGYKRGGCDEL